MSQGSAVLAQELASPHRLSSEAVATALSTDLRAGLSVEEAARRLQEMGPNELQERPGPTIWQLTLAQFNNFLVILLLAAAGVSLALGEFIDAGAILAIVALNAVLGVVQEHRANRAMEALKRLASPTARVIRGGQIADIPSRDLVPGDVLLLEAGNYVAADVRLVDAANLRIEEAALTGESNPVEKDASASFPEETPLGDRLNLAFMGTLVTYGRGQSVVTATGMRAEIGKIAAMLQSVKEEATPLQKKLEDLGKVLGTACIVIAALVVALGIARAAATDEGPVLEYIVELLLTAISLAIAAVPEGLPAIVTVCLAIGMQRMVRRNALIRKLPAVETLGSATYICSDKTGTLTQNKMLAERVYMNGRLYEVTGVGYEPEGEIRSDGQGASGNEVQELQELLRCAALCNDAVLQRVDEGGEESSGDGGANWRLIGDPTEGALVALAAKAGLWKQEQEEELPRVAEIPFDSARKWMVTVHQDSRAGGAIAYLKGAPDVVLGLCDSILINGATLPLGDRERHEVLQCNQAMASDALRVLGFALRELERAPARLEPGDVGQGCTFLGLVGMIDAARPEARDAIQLCRSAGIRPVMITGDFLTTAVAIAHDLNLLRPRGRAVTGAELDALSEDEFLDQVEDIDVYARVSPQHKVRIVDALMQREYVVAMTGDGVNDAPALKKASIGVAMGITGTDVTKEVAAMVLADDNFISIVSAIEEGRIVFRNVKQTTAYLFMTNIGEVATVLAAVFAGLPLPLLPAQILWMNLVTDGFPSLALATEGVHGDVLNEPPKSRKTPFLSKNVIVLTVVTSAIMCAGTLLLFVRALSGGDPEYARTVAFTAMAMFQLWNVFNMRSGRKSLLDIGFFSNFYVVLAVAASIGLQMAVLYVPGLQKVFQTAPLGVIDWAAIVLTTSSVVVAVELFKLAYRRGAIPKSWA